MFKEAVEDLAQRVKKIRFADDEPINIEARNKLNQGETIQLPASVEDYISFGIQTSNPEVGTTDPNQSRHVLVKVATTQGGDLGGKSMRAALDLVCLIDISGSMIGFNEDGSRGTNGKIDKLKTTLLQLISLLTDADRLSLICFNSKASRVLPLTSMGEVGKTKALKIIEDVEAGGSTNIYDALVTGLSVLDSRRQRNQVSSIFLISDGCDKMSLQALTSTFINPKAYDQFSEISINTFGFGEDDCSLMELIADKSGGIFYTTEDKDDYLECFTECLYSLVSIIAEKAKIKVKMLPTAAFPEISLSMVFNEDAEKSSELEFTWGYKFIISNTLKCLVFKVSIPPGSKAEEWKEKTVKVGTCELEFTSVDHAHTYRKVQDICFSIVENPNPKRIDSEVERQILRLEVASFQKNQIKLAEQGLLEEAKEQERIFLAKHQAAMAKQKNDLMTSNCFAQYSMTSAYINNYSPAFSQSQNAQKRKIITNCHYMKNESKAVQDMYRAYK